MSMMDFNVLSTQQLQERLCHKDILVTGCKDPKMKFDEAGLRTLSPLQRKISIQGNSIHSNMILIKMTCIDHTIQKGVPVTVMGHMEDLLANATSDGKIINGLDFPMWKDPQWDWCSYATDMVAWNYLQGNSHCGTATTPYLTGHVQWDLAGTAHAVTVLHIDSDGFATFIEVMCGKKLWAVYHPSSTLPLSSTNVFMYSDVFQLDQIPRNAPFDLEGVVLRPGDLLYVLFLFS
jgi:hypothetical protein